MPRSIAPAVLLISVLALTGCATTAAPGTALESAASGRIPVVAATNVWGDIVGLVGGAQVSVTSIIDDPNKDPHEYESDARAQLAVSRAHLIVENGGGYDDFLGRLAKGSSAAVIDVADVSGRNQHPAVGDFNEHLWYDYPTVGKLVTAVQQRLTRLAPAHRAVFAANGAAVQRRLSALEAKEAAIKRSAAGKGAAITEPVPLYMLSAAGLVNRTPPAFSRAIEDGTDVAPLVLQQQLALFSAHRVALLAYNEQTTGPTTDQVLAAAKSAAVPVIGVRETLPAHQGYFAWMNSDLDAVQKAVSG